MKNILQNLATLLVLASVAIVGNASDLPHVVFIAGKPSHAYGEHEHNAGGALLVQDLNASGLVRATLHRNGWPGNGIAQDASSVVLYMDGDGRHEVLQHMDEMAQLMARGTGFVAIHFATHVPEDVGEAQFINWLGGYYNSNTSTNPHWRGQFSLLQDHPISRGVKPFSALDEFYFNLRFNSAPGLQRVLQGTPPDEAREHVPHPRRRFSLFGGSVPEEVRNNPGRLETVGWTFERATGGRSFGFTGGHFHWNWGHADYRKLVLNGIAWTAGVEIPAQGLPAAPLDLQQLNRGLDGSPPSSLSLDNIATQFRLQRGTP